MVLLFSIKALCFDIEKHDKVSLENIARNMGELRGQKVEKVIEIVIETVTGQ